MAFLFPRWDMFLPWRILVSDGSKTATSLPFIHFSSFQYFFGSKKMQASCSGPQLVPHSGCVPVSFCKMSKLEICQALAPPQQSHQLVFQHPIGDGICFFLWGGGGAPCGVELSLTRANFHHILMIP